MEYSSPFCAKSGYDPSCGLYSVVVTKQNPDPFPVIEVRYEKMVSVDGVQDQTFRRESMYWAAGGRPSVVELAALLGFAGVPPLLQTDWAVVMILDCVDALKRRGVLPLHSLVVDVYTEEDDGLCLSHVDMDDEDVAVFAEDEYSSGGEFDSDSDNGECASEVTDGDENGNDD